MSENITLVMSLGLILGFGEYKHITESLHYKMWVCSLKAVSTYQAGWTKIQDICASAAPSLNILFFFFNMSLANPSKVWKRKTKSLEYYFNANHVKHLSFSLPLSKCRM